MKKPAHKRKIRDAKVIKGLGRGKRINIPTINFDPSALLGAGLTEEKFKEGIYICKVIFDDSSFWGVLHFGPRPTFGEQEKTLEVHLFEFGDSKASINHADIEIYDFIRDVLNFESAELMLAEIENDISFANKRIEEYKLQE